VFDSMKAHGHVVWRTRPSGAALVALGLLCAAAPALLWLDPTALCVLPALVLIVLFVLRPYPGERVLAAVARARRRPRRPARSSAPVALEARVLVPRGGLLLARSLAVRPPPAAPLAAI
jgi:hypothetical protein